MSTEAAREGRSGLGVIAVLLMVGVSSVVSASLLAQKGSEVHEEPGTQSNEVLAASAGGAALTAKGWPIEDDWFDENELEMKGSYPSLGDLAEEGKAQDPHTGGEQDSGETGQDADAAGGEESRRRRGGERGGEWSGEGRGRGRWGRDSGQDGEDGERREERDPDKDREGIPVTEPLLHQKCTACHKPQPDGRLSRISYMRKTPEGWELSLKRMIRLNKVEVTPEEARQIVRYLANDHGLARSEAERALYEVERRVHWSEEDEEEELRATCGECHTLGRVYSERRDAEEWKLLKATHLAFFPLVNFQAFQGGRRGGGGGGGGGGSFNWESASEEEIREQMESRSSSSSSRGADRADRVLSALTKELALFTPEWEAWEVNRREVPIAGTWQVVGHEVGRGDVRGTLEITRSEEDTYETEWRLTYGDGAIVKRTGKGLLYAGYSWRGRSNTTAPKQPPMLREVFLLNDEWDTFTGRLFTGEYNELGMDVTLHRRTGRSRIFHVDGGVLRTPSEGNRVDLIGDGFPKGLTAEDLYAGDGVTITDVQRVSEHLVQLKVDIADGAEHGRRFLSMGADRGPAGILIHDGIDYIKVTPGEGLARVGGEMRPPMFERFEAIGMNRGEDGKRWTSDDVEVRVVPATWAIEEFPIREDDDDAQYVGTIDAETGFFTPGIDGPNPERRWSANNIGDVYVVATCTLEAPVRSDKEDEEKEEEEPRGSRDSRDSWGSRGFRDSRESEEGEEPEEGDEQAEGEESAEGDEQEEGGESAEGAEQEEGEESAEGAEQEEGEAEDETEETAPLVYEEQEFRARGHLVVTVQIYVKWDTYQMNQR